MSKFRTYLQRVLPDDNRYQTGKRATFFVASIYTIFCNKDTENYS